MRCGRAATWPTRQADETHGTPGNGAPPCTETAPARTASATTQRDPRTSFAAPVEWPSTPAIRDQPVASLPTLAADSIRSLHRSSQGARPASSSSRARQARGILFPASAVWRNASGCDRRMSRIRAGLGQGDHDLATSKARNRVGPPHSVDIARHVVTTEVKVNGHRSRPGPADGIAPGTRHGDGEDLLPSDGDGRQRTMGSRAKHCAFGPDGAPLHHGFRRDRHRAREAGIRVQVNHRRT